MRVTEHSFPLAGIDVVITRPRHQAQNLSELVRLAGGRPVLFPVIEIAQVADPGGLPGKLKLLTQADLLIFVSQNAVTMCRQALDEYGETFPSVPVYAVGDSTAQALQDAGVSQIEAPSRQNNSEGLLNLCSLHNIKHKNIVIIRGEGGRELLADGLRARGAQVTYFECYRRVKPLIGDSPLQVAFRSDRTVFVTLTSVEAAINLVELCSENYLPILLQTMLVVASERIGSYCRDVLGFTGAILIAAQSGDRAMMGAMVSHITSAKNFQ